jgi:hypothetical protein
MTRRKTETKADNVDDRDHPDQAVDTPLPGDSVNEETWAAMATEYEGDPDEVDGQAGDDGNG